MIDGRKGCAGKKTPHTPTELLKSSQTEMQAFESYIFFENLVMIKVSGIIFWLDGSEKRINLKGDTSYL